MKSTDVWIEFYIGNFLVKDKKAVRVFEFSECALHKPMTIDIRTLEKLRRKLHNDLDLIIDHAKRRRATEEI